MTRREELQASIQKQLDEALKPFKDMPRKDFTEQLSSILKLVVEKYKPAERYTVEVTSTPDDLKAGILNCTVTDLWWRN
jgi:hypothetical protein